MRNSFVTQWCRVYGMDNAKFGYLISIFNTTKKELPPHNSEIRQVRNNFGYAVRDWGTRLKKPTPYRRIVLWMAIEMVRGCEFLFFYKITEPNGIL
jgi:hypothetical protein